MSMSSQLQSQREDVMGTYFLMNRYQCERLCWYRKLCKTYSYIYNRTLATDGNCVLHAYNITSDTTSGMANEWFERSADWDKTLQSNGCRNRSCDDTQVCVPTFAFPFYKCLPFAAECQAPSRDDGVYSDVTLVQGQRTNFTCNPSLVWASRHADKTVTCQVNSKYTELQGTCKNTTYYSPLGPYHVSLLRLAVDRSSPCLSRSPKPAPPLYVPELVSLSEEAIMTGLTINNKKTEVMRVNNKQEDPLQQHGGCITESDRFTYLGSIASKEGGAEEDIRIRTNKARLAFLRPV
ncbi:hypothetical protein C0Q70_13319 [Pomacea canaliculata]|uniref:Sushi domain-containing protein n=1 Tax=Pomacea canaliculata TaxID=400727 RepID=A0A2T7NWW3_POMCA|nr:hypothetical protein C0Q70_13319 [Pomacea canaliculata]